MSGMIKVAGSLLKGTLLDYSESFGKLVLSAIEGAPDKFTRRLSYSKGGFVILHIGVDISLQKTYGTPLHNSKYYPPEEKYGHFFGNALGKVFR